MPIGRKLVRIARSSVVNPKFEVSVALGGPPKRVWSHPDRRCFCDRVESKRAVKRGPLKTTDASRKQRKRRTRTCWQTRDNVCVCVQTRPSAPTLSTRRTSRGKGLHSAVQMRIGGALQEPVAIQVRRREHVAQLLHLLGGGPPRCKGAGSA